MKTAPPKRRHSNLARSLGFFRGLGFRGLRVLGLGFRVWGFGVLVLGALVNTTLLQPMKP